MNRAPPGNILLIGITRNEEIRFAVLTSQQNVPRIVFLCILVPPLLKKILQRNFGIQNTLN